MTGSYLMIGAERVHEPAGRDQNRTANGKRRSSFALHRLFAILRLIAARRSPLVVCCLSFAVRSSPIATKELVESPEGERQAANGKRQTASGKRQTATRRQTANRRRTANGARRLPSYCGLFQGRQRSHHRSKKS